MRHFGAAKVVPVGGGAAQGELKWRLLVGS